MYLEVTRLIRTVSMRKAAVGASGRLLAVGAFALAGVLTPVAGQAQGLAGSVPFHYKNVRIVAGGFVTGIVGSQANGGPLYARTDIGGTYRWDSAAKKWVELLNFLNDAQFNYIGTEAIGLDPNDPQRLYIAGGTYTESFEGNGAILVSNDQGRTFTVVPLPIKLGSNDAGRFAGERLLVDPNNGAHVYFFSRENGIYGSLDYGQSWAQVQSFPVKGTTGTTSDPGVGVIFGWFDKSSGTINGFTKTAYIGVSDPKVGLYVTHDGGQTFAAVAGQPVGFYPNSMSTDPSGNLYIAYGLSTSGNSVGPYSMTSGAIWKFAPATGTWTNITPPNPTNESYGFGSVAVDPVNPQIIMVSTMDRYYPPPQDDIYRSTDGGQTWKSIETNANRDVSLSPWVTFGAAKAEAGNWINHIYINPTNHNQVLYGDGQTIWATDDIEDADSVNTTTGTIVVGGATNWYVDALGVEETAILALKSPPSGPAHLISGMDDLGGFTHIDLGKSPTAGANIKPNIGNIGSIDFAEKKPLVIAQTGNTSPFGAYSTDGGVSFKQFASTPVPLTSGAGTVAVSANGATLLWAPQDAGVQTYYSTNNGTTWTVSAGSPSIQSGQNSILVSTDRVDAKYAYEYNPNTGVLYVSTDAGHTFTQAQTLATYGTLYLSPAAKGDVWFSGNGALSHSTDAGQSFTAISSVTSADNLGFGKAAPGSAYPTLYLRGAIDNFPDGFDAFFGSIDYGKTWFVVNDEQHQYGNAVVLTGDPRVYGRYYIGTNGLGIVEGNLAK
jgi:photosystem II stability/assembly factor-like uncharacterized protein